MWEPQPLTPLWAFTACYRDSFTFYFSLVKYIALTVLRLFLWDSGYGYMGVNVEMCAHNLNISSPWSTYWNVRYELQSICTTDVSAFHQNTGHDYEANLSSLSCCCLNVGLLLRIFTSWYCAFSTRITAFGSRFGMTSHLDIFHNSLSSWYYDNLLCFHQLCILPHTIRNTSIFPAGMHYN
jgi:hypothetical protein